MTIQKGIDIYKTRQDQIETIEKRRTLLKAIKRRERKKENEDSSNIHNYKRYKIKKDFESVLNNEVQKTKQQRSIKRKSERNDTSDITQNEEDEDIEDLIREHQEKRPRKFFRNTDDDSETDESGEDVILVISQSAAQSLVFDATATPSPTLSLIPPPAHSRLRPPYGHSPMKLASSIERSSTMITINYFLFIR
jgi:hypothetical protein